MRPIKLQKEALTILHVAYDCTTGSPKGRESYGDGDPIVVDGVTTIHGEQGNLLTGRRAER